MIRYKDFDFAAPSLTGTIWFTSAAKLYGLQHEPPKTFLAILKNATQPFDNTQLAFRIRISLVLNPSTWLAACYNVLDGYNKKDGSLDSCFDPFKKLNTKSISSFVADYLEKIPGSIGKMFTSYEADSCIKTEDLPHAFEELMFSLGYESLSINYAFLAKVPPRYISKLSPKLHDKVIQAEKEFCELYDYF
jgi:hypothetical protein